MIQVSINSQKFKVKDCHGFSKYTGLMFDKLHDKDGALLKTNSIWMLFTPMELDLLFLIDDKIIDIQRAIPATLNPNSWRIYKCLKADSCLELKAGLFKGRVGDRVRIS